MSSDGGGIVQNFPEWSHPQSSGYDTEYNSWKSDHLPPSIVALQQNNILSPMSPQQPSFAPPAAPPTQPYCCVGQSNPAMYNVEPHPPPGDVKAHPPHYIIHNQQDSITHMGYKSHTFPTLPNLPNRTIPHNHSMQFPQRKLSSTSSGISSMTASSRNQSLMAGFRQRKGSADSNFSTDRSSNASSFQSSHTGGRSIGPVPQSPYPSPPESRQSSQYGSEKSGYPASWHGDSNGPAKPLHSSFSCDISLVNRREVNKSLRRTGGGGMLRTKEYVQSLPQRTMNNNFSNMEPLPLPASMQGSRNRNGAQSPIPGMEMAGMEPASYMDQSSPMQVSGDMSCADIVVATESFVKGTQPLCHLEPAQLPPPSYESSMQCKTWQQQVAMDTGNMIFGDMANMMYSSKGCYDNGTRF